MENSVLRNIFQLHFYGIRYSDWRFFEIRFDTKKKNAPSSLPD